MVFSGSAVPDFTIRADLNSSFSCLSFPENFKRSRKNNIDLFPLIIDKNVVEVIQYPFERLFHIHLEDDLILLFKMFGSHSNILLFQQGKCLNIFKNNLKKDRALRLSELQIKTDLSYERFLQLNSNPKKFIPAFDNSITEHLEARGYQMMDTAGKYHLVKTVLNELETANTFYIIYKPVLPVITLLKPRGDFKSFNDIIDALNFFYKERIYVKKFDEERSDALKKISRDLEKATRYIDLCKIKLEAFGNEDSYKQIGDIIMANLNAINQGSDHAVLFNFYTGDSIKIPLKPGVPPQKNAENYYRKSKNQKIELDKLKENSQQKILLASQLREKLKLIENMGSLKELRALLAQSVGKGESAGRKNVTPYRRFIFLDYEILIGKNSKKNEELTFGTGSKNDLWLHAKDVPGSHVIIRNKPGHNIPDPVINRAAELAAYFSKNRTNSMCPVIYTERKFVRKLKGGAVGQVIVEREKVIFVEPGM